MAARRSIVTRLDLVFVYICGNRAGHDEQAAAKMGKGQSVANRVGALAAILLTLLAWRLSTAARPQIASAQIRRNVLIFVADGLRPGSITAEDMPTLSALREKGVDFRNSHSLFPTFTMPNASAIATGHGFGDTSTFSNVLWAGYATFESGNFKAARGTPVPFLENDLVLADLDDHYGKNFVGEQTFLALARENGYQTAAIGKRGPTAMQEVASISPAGGTLPLPASVIIDDATGTAAGIPLRPDIVKRLVDEGLSPDAPARNNGYDATSRSNNGYTGDNTHAGTLMANVVQQQWFADVTTRVVLPMFEQDAGRPFALVYWSRDPDGTQHNQGDSPRSLRPGINGPTSRLAVRNADRNLRQLLEWLERHPSLNANTDLVVTSDHGFATVSKREVDSSGRPTASEAAKHVYRDAGGEVDTERGTLPPGFLAIDLAVDLRLNLYDPDQGAPASPPYKKLRLTSETWEHPVAGNGLIGDAVRNADGSDATAIVAAGGGSDLVYVPDGNRQTVRRIVNLLLTYDYVGGVFVEDKYGDVPGTLPLSAIGLRGSGALPRPDIVVPFKVFYLNPNDLQTGVQVADTVLREGQGYHGGFGRESTFNTMVAWGPDFRRRFVDAAPVSNADIVPTLAHLLGLPLQAKGPLQGRVVREALEGSGEAACSENDEGRARRPRTAFRRFFIIRTTTESGT